MNSEKLLQFAAATNNELYDPKYRNGEWMAEAFKTQETLDHWVDSAKNWLDKSKVKSGEIAGCPFLAWERAQSLKGQQRRSLTVIDFGEYRIVLTGTDVTFYI